MSSWPNVQREIKDLACKVFFFKERKESYQGGVRNCKVVMKGCLPTFV
jgi:hypothetical protein